MWFVRVCLFNSKHQVSYHTPHVTLTDKISHCSNR
jgi:hypothetical protein